MALALLVLYAPGARGAPPPNDDFENATVLSGFPVEAEGTNVDATEQLGEPPFFFADTFDVPSVWWRWTAPSSGPVEVRACPPPGDRDTPNMGVFVGDSLQSLIPVAAFRPELDVPGCTPGAYGGTVSFFAEAGRTYSITVVTVPRGDHRLRVVQAATAVLERVVRAGEPRVRVAYRALPGRRNSASVQLEWGPTLPRQPFSSFPPPVAFQMHATGGVARGFGCGFARPESGFSECPIPVGLGYAGPFIKLGDLDDAASVEYSRADTVVLGGAGDDGIKASGTLNGGPGDDQIEARQWVPARIRGGPGDDYLLGSARRDFIDPGPGNDRVSTRGVVTRDGPGDYIDARDGDIDYITCFAKDSADIEGIDAYPELCGTVRRHGPARTIPENDPLPYGVDIGHNSIQLLCPVDGPEVCAGTVTISRRGRVFVRRHFRHRRLEPRESDIAFVFYRASRSLERVMRGEVTITVRSRDRAGKLRTASGTYTAS